MPTQNAVYIGKLSINQYKCFHGNFELNFLNNNSIYQWTVILGNNGTGKTNLLKAICAVEPCKIPVPLNEKGEKANDGFAPSSIFTKNKIENYKSIGVQYYAGENINSPLSLVKQYNHFNNKIAEQKSFFTLNENSADVAVNPIFANINIDAYGVSRIIEKKGISESTQTISNSETLFNLNKRLINFEDWLFQLDYASKNGQKLASQRIELIKSILLSDLLPDITDFSFKSDNNLNNYIEFYTKEGHFRLQDLGYGYQASISWIFDFCKKMFDRYPNVENPLAQPAILLIDEIDLHLHPQWQRTIIKDLSKIFPQTQFIVTTHSPLVIQSIENINLYVLSQNKTEGVSIKHIPEQTFQGWNVEEILETIMNLGSDINSDLYQNLIKSFDIALDKNDYNEAKSIYERVLSILKTDNIRGQILKMQLESIKND